MSKPVASPWRALGVAACVGLMAVGGIAGQTPDIVDRNPPEPPGCSEAAGAKVRLGGLRPDPMPNAKLAVKRLNRQSEADLRKQLATLPQAKVGKEGLPVPSPTVWGTRASAPTFVMNKETLGRRTDLAMLPVRMGKDCELAAEKANNLRLLARDLRQAVAMTRDGAYGDDDVEPVATVLRVNFTRRGKAFMEDFSKPTAVPVLMQMLTPEPAAIRAVLVEQLARIEGKDSSVALAKLAVFDLDLEVRSRALEALSSRPREEYRSVLLDGLKYPWAPAADHAAEGLVALADTEVLPLLQELVKQPPPDAVFENSARQKVVREVVRINHLANCTLCHQQDTASEGKIRAAVPIPGYPLPPATEYYARGDIFVRADVTYLRQDFSVTHAVKDHGSWPEHQRFDYLVRTRPATEVDASRKPDPAFKEALQFAIAQLTTKKEAQSRATP